MINSPGAAKELEKAIIDGLSPIDYECDYLMGQTDCPEGCTVEPDGRCYHLYKSAARTLGII